MDDALQDEYARGGAPVLFVEHDANDPKGSRIDRWWAAYDARGEGGAAWPLVLIDSGYRMDYGYQANLRETYIRLVNECLERPPSADINASYRVKGGDVVLTATVTNRSSQALGPDNWATLSVLVYEHARAVHTGRIVRAVAELDIWNPLPHGATRGYSLRATDVPVERWDQAEVVVVLDYQPSLGTYLYDALQSARAARLGQAAIQLPLLLDRYPE